MWTPQVVQWICLRIKSWDPWIEIPIAPSMLLSIVKFCTIFCHCAEKRTKINKKEAGFGPNLNYHNELLENNQVLFLSTLTRIALCVKIPLDRQLSHRVHSCLSIVKTCIICCVKCTVIGNFPTQCILLIQNKNNQLCSVFCSTSEHCLRPFYIISNPHSHPSGCYGVAKGPYPSQQEVST